MFLRDKELASIVVCEHEESTLETICDHLTADRYDVLSARPPPTRCAFVATTSPI